MTTLDAALEAFVAAALNYLRLSGGNTEILRALFKTTIDDFEIGENKA